VASNVVAQVSQRLGQPLALDVPGFLRHCSNSLALPYPIVTNLTPLQIARFQEQATTRMGVDIEMQSTRVYPHQTAAAHVLGYVQRNLDSVEGEESYFSYRLPGYRGQLGIEAAFDQELRGKAGAKSILVNSVGFRQAENVWSQAEPGTNVVLTIDLYLQQAAERALPVFGPNTRGALVVMDVQTGDLLAMVSSPTLNPNHSIQGYPPGELARRHDMVLRPEINRATQENYAPGSIFKTVVGLACLEAGLDPNEIVDNPGYIFVGKRHIEDLAAAGRYDFRRALIHSSNTYFISNGLHCGIENIVKLGHIFHLGESTGLRTRQETAGIFPSLKRVSSDWFDGDTANICIGQGKMAVTPLQMAVMTAAIANGGKVLWPRLVDRVEPQIPVSDPVHFETARVRDELNVKPKNLQVLREAMVDDVEQAGGTGHAAYVPGIRICAKTGTAQVQDVHNKTIGDTVWFASFAPYEKPRYAVVVMVEVEHNGGSGGKTCAPIAANMYKAIQKREQMGTPKPPALATTQ
jgi:penicillin-binding protein 2